MRSAEITRQVILHAALNLFAEEGFETVGVRDIGLRAKVDPSLVNRYYGGKEELFIEVVKACHADWRHLWGAKQDFAARVVKEVLHGGNDGKVTVSRARRDRLCRSFYTLLIFLVYSSVLRR